MSVFRLATFNVENLFARYNFNKNIDPAKGAQEGFLVNDTAFTIYEDTAKRITAKAIKAVNADIICLQEVENLKVLDRFCTTYLKGNASFAPYEYRLLIDGNDPRQIDVAILSRFPIAALHSHRHERNGSHALFSRDCLRAEVDINGKTLTLYINHLKSMMGGRGKTRKRRMMQASRVAEIIVNDQGPRLYRNIVVLGDMNDYMDPATPQENSLMPLTEHPKLVNILQRLPENDRWTHYYKREKAYRQLDYLLLSKSFDKRAGYPVPAVERRGLPLRAQRVTAKRFAGVGKDNPKASDHAPLYVDIPLDALK